MDVVEAVSTSFASSPVRFIHVEVFRDNDPAKGYNRWMRQWGLRSEPWTFLVGRDGKVIARYAPNDTPESIERDVEKALQ